MSHDIIFLGEVDNINSTTPSTATRRSEIAAALSSGNTNRSVINSMVLPDMNGVPLINIADGDHVAAGHNGAPYPGYGPAPPGNGGAAAAATYGVLVPGMMPTFVSLGQNSFVHAANTQFMQQHQPAAIAAPAGHQHHPYGLSYEYQQQQPPPQTRADAPHHGGAAMLEFHGLQHNPYLVPASMGMSAAAAAGRFQHPHHMAPHQQHQLQPLPYMLARPPHFHSPYAVGPMAAAAAPPRGLGGGMPAAPWPHAMPGGGGATLHAAANPFNPMAYPTTATRMHPHVRMPPHACVEGASRRRRTTNASADLARAVASDMGQAATETAAATDVDAHYVTLAEAAAAPATTTQTRVKEDKCKSTKRTLSERSLIDIDNNPPPSKTLDQIGAEEDGQCCVCLEEPSTYELASINGCAHNFCFTCIEKWSDRENTCPLCKIRFTKIDRVNKPSPYKKRKRGEQRSRLTKKVRNRDQRADLGIGVSTMRIPNASADPAVDRRRPIVLFSNLPGSLLSLHNALGLTNPSTAASSALNQLAQQQQQQQHHLNQQQQQQQHHLNQQQHHHHHPQHPHIPFDFGAQDDFYWRI